MEENKMSLLKELAKYTVGAAVGLGIGYGVFKADVKDCKAIYQAELAAFDTTYKDVQVPQGVASAKDLSLEYVVAKDAGFRGLTVKDSISGKTGIVTKNTMFGGNVYSIAFPDGFDAAFKSPTAKMDIQPQVQVYKP